jgi:aspartyl-tRNA(Asn)/glutamyl-tRNA(Gln) amidotransferase subunit C
VEKTGFDVGYVARLAHIDLAADEAERFASQLGDILKYMEKLKELDVSGVEPTMHGHGRVNAFREDEPVASMDGESFLRNAPGRIGDEYRLPKIVEEA